MATVTVSISCCLCDADHKAEIVLPDGWTHRYSGIDDEEAAFCPDHAKVAYFAAEQCPGCVSGWGDCPMWRAFAYDRRTITPEDLAIIRTGRCPRRTNGTFGMGANGRFKDINLSEVATSESGEAFARAIEDYCRRYPART